MVLVPTLVLAAASSALRFILLVHGALAVAIGVLLVVLAPSGPSYSVLRMIPGWPWSWGLILAFGGALTVVGRLTGHLPVARLGIHVQAVWYVVQAVGLFAAIHAGAASYAGVLYLALAAVVFAHLRWLTEHGDWRPAR
jgi:hypothetical protein